MVVFLFRNSKEAIENTEDSVSCSDDKTEEIQKSFRAVNILQSQIFMRVLKTSQFPTIFLAYSVELFILLEVCMRVI